MIISNTTPNECERLLELYHYDLLDTVEDNEFDEIVQLASRLCNTPISTVTLIDSHRQWFKAKVGVTDAENPREISFCSHVVADEADIFTVEDASKDERFMDYPNVTGQPHIRFYAGVPLITQKGHRLGALCVINSKPQQLTEEQSFALKVLGRQVVKLAEQRLQNRYLQNYQKRLQQQAEMQNKILAIVAHDIRSPLVSLQGIIELSQENVITDEKRGEMIEMWKQQLDNTMCLLTNLIDWGKIQAGSDVISRNVINLYDIVQDEFIQCGSVATEKENTLENDIHPKFLLYGDENVIRFIIRNTLSNSNKFTENGTITINALRKKNVVTISLTDTGIGMTKEQLSGLMNGKPSMVGLGTRNEKGSGLGFMLIKDFVEILEGTIQVESSPGKGTSICIEIKA